MARILYYSVYFKSHSRPGQPLNTIVSCKSIIYIIIIFGCSNGDICVFCRFHPPTPPYYDFDFEPSKNQYTLALADELPAVPFHNYTCHVIVTNQNTCIPLGESTSTCIIGDCTIALVWPSLMRSKLCFVISNIVSSFSFLTA